MKKFATLFCALALVFGASTAQTAHKALAPQRASRAVEQVQKVQLEQAKPAVKATLENAQLQNLNQFNASKALKVTNQKAQAPVILGKKVFKANHAAPAVAATPAKVLNAVPEDINVTAVDWVYDGYYYDVYLYSETTTYLFELKEDLVYGKNYTYADMVPTWVCTLEDDYPDIMATDATLTVSKDEAGLTHIAATMVLNGDKHVIAYDEKPFEPSGVQIKLDGTELSGKYNSWYYMYIYTAKVGENEIQLAFDATAEQATYTKDQLIADYCVYASPDYSTYVEFVKAASDFTVTNTETTKTLTGSLYDKNGDEYVFNLTYEKPDAKEITLVADTLNFFTKMLNAGYYQMQGYTVDSTYAFSFYFISKSLSGNYTEEDMDAYSTWVDQKDGKKTVVSYQNLSAANIKASLVNDTLYYTGTMTLATNDGQEANITLNLSCPYTQEWGEWTDFAPFDVNTGKYAFSAALSTTQTNMPVQVRKDNTGLKQYKFIGWGKQVFTANGIDLLVDMAPDYSCTIAEQSTGFYQTSYGEYLMISDMNTYIGSTSYSSTYDPETGVFQLPVVYYISLGNFGYGYETMTMDQPISERDTVKVTADMKIAAEPAKGIIKVSAELNDTSYILEVVGTDTVGTFSLADGTLSQKYYYGIVSAAGRSEFAEGSVTIAKNETGLKLDGLMIGVDEKAYVLDWTFTPITERDTVKVNLKAITIEEDVNSTSGAHRGWLYEGQDTDTLYIVQVLGNNKLGTFSYAAGTLGQNFYNIIPSNGQGRQQFTEGEVTIVEDEEGVKLNGLFIGEDEKAYVLNWIQPAGILQYDTDAPFDATFAWSDMEATIEDGVIGIYATNADMQTIGLELYTDPALSEIPAGTYVISDSKEAGTALQSVGVVGGYLTECWAGNRAATGGIDDCWFIVEGTVTLSYDEYDKLKVVVDGKNSWGQPVSALVQYEKLQPKDTVIVNDASLSVVEDYMEEMGIVYFYCEGTEHAFDLYAYADTIYGDFTNIDYRDCGYYSIDGDSASILDVFELNVSAEGKNMTLKAQVLTSDTILYVVNATGYYGAFAFDTNADFNASFSTENMTTKTITRSKKSCKIISAVNEAGDSVSILFRTSQKPAAGTYEINYTESANTVIASDGDTFENVSLAARSKDGGDPDIWFMVSGTVTIDELGNITVNALNSYDKAVKFTISVPEPEYYLYNYYYGKYLGWNGSSSDKNKIAMMDESDRMAVTVTLTDADNKRFTTSVTSTDDKAMYLSMGSGFNFHSGSPYAGEQDNGYWYKVKDITASSIEAEKVSEIEEGEFYIIVHNYNGYCALGGSVTDTDGNGKMRILGYKLDSADDMITLDRSDILPYVYRYVTADTPAMDPATSVKPVMQKNDDSIFNVAGQRTLNPSKGNIYIINGKKIMFE